MPKRKRVQQVANSGEKHHSRVEAHNLFPDTPKAKKISKTSSTPRGHRSSQNLPLVPFMNDDTILLVGEGDPPYKINSISPQAIFHLQLQL